MKYKCLIFDCDGVLVDSEKISAKVFQEMLSELGCQLDFETVLKQITGTSMKENLKFFTKKLGHGLPENFEQEFRKRSYDAFKTDLQPIPGIHELLEKITMPIGVASSGPTEKIRRTLETTQLLDKFDGHVFSCFDIGSWKPKPDIYLHAARTMGFKPNECAVIEDSITGVKAGLAGGFDVFGYASHNNKAELENLGAIVFSDMKELESLLNK